MQATFILPATDYSSHVIKRNITLNFLCCIFHCLVILAEIFFNYTANFFLFFLSEPSCETKTSLSHQYSSNIKSSSRWVGEEIFHIIMLLFTSWLFLMILNVCIKEHMDWDFVTLQYIFLSLHYFIFRMPACCIVLLCVNSFKQQDKVGTGSNNVRNLVNMVGTKEQLCERQVTLLKICSSSWVHYLRLFVYWPSFLARYLLMVLIIKLLTFIVFFLFFRIVTCSVSTWCSLSCHCSFNKGSDCCPWRYFIILWCNGCVNACCKTRKVTGLLFCLSLALATLKPQAGMAVVPTPTLPAQVRNIISSFTNWVVLFSIIIIFSYCFATHY